MKKQSVDTPRAGSWAEQVNKPGFIPARTKPQSVRLKVVSEQEGRELSAILSGKGRKSFS